MKKILTTIIIILIFIFLTLIYSRFIATKFLNTNEISLNTNIRKSYDGLNLVHFSDLHYKKIITEEQVKNLIKEINKLNPDIVVFTGDLISDDYKLTNTDTNFLIEQLSNINSKYGSFSILGDNDLSDKETIKNIYLQSNFKLLEEDYTIIYNEENDKILLTNSINETTPFLTDTSVYKIILTHYPDNIDFLLSISPNIDLILSGHSLNGHINIPIIKKLFLPDDAKKYYDTYYQINNTNIYISNGIGVDKINFRLFNTPSINFYRINSDS